MRRDEALGTFDDVADRVPEHRPILERLRALIAERDPDALEKASAKEGSVWWGVGPAKMTDGYAWAMPHASHVNLGFFQGAELVDPTERLEGTGRSLRHVKLRSVDDADDPAVLALLDAAIALKRTS